MGTALIYLLVMVLVAAVVFLASAVIFGRGEEMAPIAAGASPTKLPSEEIAADDVREVRFQQVVRGYKMSEVDWVLDRVAGQLESVTVERDELRAKVSELEDQPSTPS